MSVVQAFYVQDAESGYFMRSDGEGDIQYCMLITDAEAFDSREAAIDTASICLNQWVVFSCWKNA